MAPEKRVFMLEEDFLMSLVTLSLIATKGSYNLLYLVLDN